MSLYHSEIFLPSDIRLPAGASMLTYSQHAKEESKRDRYGFIELPKVIKYSEWKVIEVEVTKGKVTKVLYRKELDSERDICLVVIPQRGFVKTVWVNLRSDKHLTLDHSKYLQA